MIYAFAKTGAAKWNNETAEYEPYELPENCPLMIRLSELGTEINCASCAKKAVFGKCYTSKEIHNRNGFGYPVCEDCHNKEIENWRKK